mmetsp:Transcript_77114/g.195765  ORF Transcript_77114/g.195765 Transcript_77114/m.195765 type:complete len:348 (+) Transcript_77114:155-1198(+)
MMPNFVSRKISKDAGCFSMASRSSRTRTQSSGPAIPPSGASATSSRVSEARSPLGAAVDGARPGATGGVDSGAGVGTAAGVGAGASRGGMAVEDEAAGGIASTEAAAAADVAGAGTSAGAGAVLVAASGAGLPAGFGAGGAGAALGFGAIFPIGTGGSAVGTAGSFGFGGNFLGSGARATVLPEDCGYPPVVASFAGAGAAATAAGFKGGTAPTDEAAEAFCLGCVAIHFSISAQRVVSPSQGALCSASPPNSIRASNAPQASGPDSHGMGPSLARAAPEEAIRPGLGTSAANSALAALASAASSLAADAPCRTKASACNKRSPTITMKEAQLLGESQTDSPVIGLW